MAAGANPPQARSSRAPYPPAPGCVVRIWLSLVMLRRSVRRPALLGLHLFSRVVGIAGEPMTREGRETIPAQVQADALKGSHGDHRLRVQRDVVADTVEHGEDR